MRRRTEWLLSSFRTFGSRFPTAVTIRRRRPPLPTDSYATALGGGKQAALNQLLIPDSRGRSGLGQAGVVLWIGQNSWQWIDLDDIGNPRGIEPDVDSRPIAAAESVVRPQRHLFDCLAQRFVDRRRALEHPERLFRSIPDPFGFKAVDRQRPVRQGVEPNAHDRQDASIATIS